MKPTIALCFMGIFRNFASGTYRLVERVSPRSDSSRDEAR